MKDFIRIPQKRMGILKKDKKLRDKIEEFTNIKIELNDEVSIEGVEIINLSEFTKSKERLKVLKGRIIGTGGKTKKYIEKYADVKTSIFGKTVAIIGKWDKIYIAREAIMKLIQGCAHQTLYRWLERQAKK